MRMRETRTLTAARLHALAPRSTAARVRCTAGLASRRGGAQRRRTARRGAVQRVPLSPTSRRARVGSRGRARTSSLVPNRVASCRIGAGVESGGPRRAGRPRRYAR